MTDSKNLLTRLGYDVDALRAPWPPGRPAHTCNPPDKQPLQIPKTEETFTRPDLQIEPTPPTGTNMAAYHVTEPATGATWTVETKVVLADSDVLSIASIAARFAPAGSTVSMQADTHGAGNVYVGMIMSFNETSIPVNMVSGDIGCGLSIVPVVKDRIHIKEDAATRATHPYILATMRRTLKRGKGAENGEYLSRYIRHAAEFYGLFELPVWLDEIRDILDHVGVTYESYAATDQAEETYQGLTAEQSVVLRYIGRYAQSLGSSGNHFMELSTDEEGHYWIVVHSGSRGLGARVYDTIAEACRIYNKATAGFSCEVATGPLAMFYARAYDALNKFAQLNRIMCAVAVLHDLGYTIDVEQLRTTMHMSAVFKKAIDACEDNMHAALMLLSGLTHNGLKAYVNDDTRQVHYVLSKGAIAMTRRAAASIVALRAGDGCYVWTLADLRCPWREIDVRKALSLGYEVVYHVPDIIFSGHGAGRTRSTTKTADMSSFEAIAAFCAEKDVVANIAPGLLGDNPAIAYNDVPTILKHLPLDIACTKSQLRTRVAHKEGITYQDRHIKACATYVQTVWPTADDATKLTLDLNLCSKFLPAYTEMAAERDAILARQATEMGLTLERSH